MGIPRNPISLASWGAGILTFAFLVFWMLDEAFATGKLVALVAAAVTALIGAWLMRINND